MMTKITHRCSGHCCQNFAFFLTPAEIKSQLKHFMAHKDDPDFYQTRNCKGEAWDPEFEIIGKMLVPLKATRLKKGNRYTCKHFKDGNCHIYDRRPKMCSQYPYGHPCGWLACTWQDAALATNKAFDMRVVKRRLLQKFYQTMGVA